MGLRQKKTVKTVGGESLSTALKRGVNGITGLFKTGFMPVAIICYYLMLT
jgi:hypothetical protein